MTDYRVIAIDLAKTKFHFVAMNYENKVILKQKMHRQEFFDKIESLFPSPKTFAFEACGGCHYVAQRLEKLGHKVILLKPKDVKPYAKSRQKNDLNDAIAIARAALDPEIKHVKHKTIEQQQVAYLHKSRQNTIQQRIQRSNSIMTSLQEFGYIAKCGKSQFAKDCHDFIKNALESGYIAKPVYDQMLLDCDEIKQLIKRERELDKEIISSNKSSKAAILLETIPGIGPINASILGNKSMETYEDARDFAASLGLVPKQSTTGGTIRLGSITKHGDRYARTMLVQGARSLLMRAYKPNIPDNRIYKFIEILKKSGKGFNVICVAVANKLARIAYACIMKKTAYGV